MKDQFFFFFCFEFRIKPVDTIETDMVRKSDLETNVIIVIVLKHITLHQ